MSGWWHGGPRISGDWILPPSETGARPLIDGYADQATAGYDPTRVFVVNSKPGALLFACVHRNAWIYEVEPVGELTADPDHFDPSGESLSMMAERARIIRRFKPSNHELLIAAGALLGEQL